MDKIGKRRVTHEQSINVIDWTEIAQVIAREYLKGEINDKGAMEGRAEALASS